MAVPRPSEQAVRYHRSGNVLWIVSTLWGLLVAVGLAVVVVVPPLAYLFRLTQTEEWTRH